MNSIPGQKFFLTLITPEGIKPNRYTQELVTNQVVLLHSEFLNDPASHRWRITDWSSAVRIALGRKCLCFYRGAFAVLLTPTVLLASYSLYAARYELLLPAILSFWGFWTSSTRPTGIGMTGSIFTAALCFVLGNIQRDQVIAFAGLLPGISWFGSCAILGVTASSILDALRVSQPVFEDLVRHDILTTTDNCRDTAHR